MKATLIKNEVVALRADPFGANRAHCDTWNLMAEIGGGVAINYGIFLAIPKHQKSKKRAAAEALAGLLEDCANAY